MLSTSPETMRDLFEALTDGWESIEPDQITGDKMTIHALIPALRDAVFGGMESTGGAGGFNAKMPIDSGALDLYQAIDREISEAWASAFPNQVPGAERMEALLSQFVAVTKGNPSELVTITRTVQRVERPGMRDEHWWVERDTIEYTAIALLKRWVSQIREFFDPPRRREITDACVECGEEWAVRDDAGEQKPYRVFVFEQDESGNTLAARCLACGAWWGLGQMKELASKIAAQARAREPENVGG